MRVRYSSLFSVARLRGIGNGGSLQNLLLPQVELVGWRGCHDNYDKWWLLVDNVQFLQHNLKKKRCYKLHCRRLSFDPDVTVHHKFTQEGQSVILRISTSMDTCAVERSS